jgi:Family of unknown function (DUF6516)
MQYMATVLIKIKYKLDDGVVVEIVVWLLDAPVPPCRHRYKYRLYYGADGKARVRYDNEVGKGDHVHYGDLEQPYHFSTVEHLLDDFERDINQWGEQQ